MSDSLVSRSTIADEISPEMFAAVRAQDVTSAECGRLGVQIVLPKNAVSRRKADAQAEQIHAVIREAYSLIENRQYLEARQLLLCVMQSTAVSGTMFCRGQAILEMADTYYQLGDFQTALEFCRRHLPEYQAPRYNFLRLRFHNFIAASAFVLWDFECCLLHAHKALDLAVLLQDVNNEAKNLIVLGELYKDIEEYATSRVHFQKAHLLALKHHLYGRASEALRSLAMLNTQTGAAELGLKQFYQAVIAFHGKGSERWLSECWFGIANAKIKLGDYFGAQYFLRKAYDLANSVKHYHICASSDYFLAKVLLAVKCFRSALSSTERGIELASQLGDIGLEAGFYNLRSEIYEQTGNHEFALQEYLQYLDLFEKGLNEEKLQLLAQLDARLSVARRRRMQQKEAMQHEAMQSTVRRKKRELHSLAQQQRKLAGLVQEIESRIARLIDGDSVRIKHLCNLIMDVHSQIQQESDFSNWENKLNDLSDGFVTLLSRQCPNLTTTELRTCLLVKFGCTSKQIGDLLCLSVRTVEVNRRNIRKKLQVRSHERLFKVLQMFEQSRKHSPVKRQAV